MRLVLAAVIAIGAVTSLNAIRAPQRGVQPAADMVLTNGTILTVDANDADRAGGGDRGRAIVAVGTNDAVKPRIGADTRGDRSARPDRDARPDRHARRISPKPTQLFSSTSAIPPSRRWTTCWRGSRRRWRRLKPGEWVRGRRLGRRQARRASLHHGRGSRQGRARTIPCGSRTRPATTASPTATR